MPMGSKEKPKWKLVTFHEDGKQFTTWHHEKPDFKLMYKKIGTTMIEMSTGYMPELSNRKDGYVDLYLDEESKLKGPVQVNPKITKAWYDWLQRTGRQCLKDDFISGKVCVFQKVEEEAA